jgi:drug/metabolite transporter (DMT)-like permease
MDARRPIDGFATAVMLVLCVLWGTQQVVIKLTAPDVVPAMQMTLRNGTSALLVAAVLVVRRLPVSFRNSTLRPGLLAGALFGVEFLLIAEGLRLTTASHMSVLIYTAPVFAGLGLHLLLPAERLTRLQWLGIAVAFAGIVLAFTGGPSVGPMSLRMLAGDALGLLAGVTWGATTVVVRASALAEAPAAQTLLYQLAVGFLVQLAYCTVTGQAGGVASTPIAWASLLFQGVVVSFASYLVWFWLLRRYLASRLSVFTFLTPLLGVTAGVVILDEPLGVRFVLGGALVLAGITVVSGGYLFRKPTTR